MLACVAWVNSALESHPEWVYNRISGSGVLRLMLLRRIGKDTLSVVQVRAEDIADFVANPEHAEILAFLRSVPVGSVFVTGNVTAFEGIRPDARMLPLKGEAETFFEELGGCKFKVSPLAFSQVNTSAANILLEYVAQSVKHDVLLDLCCGSGPLGIAAARKTPSAEVIGIDLVEASIEDARDNAELNAIRAVYHCGAVESVLPALHIPSGAVSALVDPPRQGLPPRLIKHILANGRITQLIYVSCSYKSVEENLRSLLGAGFNLKEVWAVDMFPFTREIEAVFLLER